MKFLRTLFLIATGILLLPIILLVEVMCFVWFMIIFREPKKAVRLWIVYIKKGLEMNKDFIVNGL